MSAPSAGCGAPPAAARWATFTLFVANGFGFGAWATAIPPLKAMLSLSTVSLSYALLAMTIGGGIALQPSSYLIEKLGGTGRATRLASPVFALALALPMLAPSLPVLILATAFLGAAVSIMDVAMNAHASSVERQWGHAIMSSFHAGFSLGGMAGTGFGALMLWLHVPTPLLLVPTAAVALALILFATPHLGEGHVERAPEGTHFKLPEKRLIGLALITLFCLMVEGAMADWSGVYLTTIGLSAAAAASGYGTFSATMVGGRLIGDRIVRRIGRSMVIGAGAVLASVGLVLSVAVPHVVAIIGGFALVGIGLSNVVPCVFSASAALGRTPASGIATASTAGFGGMLAGPPLIGAVAAKWGMRSGIGVIAGAAVAAAMISMVFRTDKAATDKSAG